MVQKSAFEESLARIPFFAGLDESDIERVAAGTRTRRFRRGEVIFHAGDPGDALFIIVSGETFWVRATEWPRRGSGRSRRY